MDKKTCGKVGRGLGWEDVPGHRRKNIDVTFMDYDITGLPAWYILILLLNTHMLHGQLGQ